MNIYTQMSNTVKFPKMFDLTNNEVKLSEYIVSINESLKNLLMTSKGELLGDLEYGTNLLRFVYQNNDPNILNELVADELVDAITRYETRVYVNSQNITFYNDRNKLYIKISYLIKVTDSVEELNLLLREEEMKGLENGNF